MSQTALFLLFAVSFFFWYRSCTLPIPSPLLRMSLTNVSYECLLRMSLTNVSSSRRLFFKSFIYRYRTTVEFVKRNLRVRFSINGATRARRGNGVPNQTTHTTNQAGNHSFLSLAYYVLAKLTLSSLKHWIIAALR